MIFDNRCSDVMSKVRGLLQPTSLAHFYTNILPTRSSAARSAVTSIRVTNLYYSVPQPFANAGSITDSTIESVLTVGNSIVKIPRLQVVQAAVPSLLTSSSEAWRTIQPKSPSLDGEASSKKDGSSSSVVKPARRLVLSHV